MNSATQSKSVSVRPTDMEAKDDLESLSRMSRVWAMVPIALATAAVVCSGVSRSKRVSVTAWIAVAIVGTADCISMAAMIRSRLHQRKS